MSIELTYYGRLPGLNELINMNRTNKYFGAKVKRGDQRELANIFYLQSKGERLTGHATVYIRFYEKDNRRDDDNVIGGGCKILLDAMTFAKIIPDDSPKYVHLKAERITLEGSAKYREQNARIEIDIVPDGEEVPLRTNSASEWVEEQPAVGESEYEEALENLPPRKCKICGRVFKPFSYDPVRMVHTGKDYCCITCTQESLRRKKSEGK